MKIVVFSDSHFCGPPSGWTSLFDGRLLGLFNYHYRRQHQHDQKWLIKMVDYILEIKPDVAICAGDVSTGGEPSEFNKACETLSPLVNNSSIKFFYIPGNHDYYVDDPKCIKSLKSAYAYLNEGKQFDELPYSLIYKDIDFCFVNESWPTLLVLSTGIMKRKTVKYVCNWTEQDNSKPKVLVGHFPLWEKHPLIRFRHRLYGQKKVLKKLREKKIDLSICGHKHSPNATLDNTGRGEIIAGSVTKNACGALIEYDKTKDIFTYNKINLRNL